jgi:hypothetical protein
VRIASADFWRSFAGEVIPLVKEKITIRPAPSATGQASEKESRIEFNGIPFNDITSIQQHPEWRGKHERN